MAILRSIGKTCLASAISWIGARRLVERSRESLLMPFIVAYHRVVENFNRSSETAIPSLLTSTAMLERHIDWLSSRYSFVTLDEIASHLESNPAFIKPVAAITFDDGYSDVYHQAYPLLKRKGIPATVFVVTGLAGTGRRQIFDRFYALLWLLEKRGLPLGNTLAGALNANGLDSSALAGLTASDEEPLKLMTIALNAFPQEQIVRVLAFLDERFPVPQHELDEMTALTWDMIETMHRGGITIGSHTASHCLLPVESPETTRLELVDSKDALERRLGVKVNHFAYPDGRFNPAVVQAVKNAGYRLAYGNCRSRDRDFPHLTIPRKVLWERSCV